MTHGNDGNQYGLAIKDPAIRQDAFKDFCDHLSEGKALKSWYYDKNGHRCIWATMLSYLDKYPDEFDLVKKHIAEAKGYQKWESVVADSAVGENQKANTASLQMVMRNKYGWDKKEDQEKDQSHLLSSVVPFLEQLSSLKDSNEERIKKSNDK